MSAKYRQVISKHDYWFTLRKTLGDRKKTCLVNRNGYYTAKSSAKKMKKKEKKKKKEEED